MVGVCVAYILVELRMRWGWRLFQATHRLYVCARLLLASAACAVIGSTVAWDGRQQVSFQGSTHGFEQQKRAPDDRDGRLLCLIDAQERSVLACTFLPLGVSNAWCLTVAARWPRDGGSGLRRDRSGLWKLSTPFPRRPSFALTSCLLKNGGVQPWR